MGKISDELERAEQALNNVIRLMKDVSGKEKTRTTQKWISRVRDAQQDVKNLQRVGWVIDIQYGLKKK